MPVCGRLQTLLHNELAGTGKHANLGRKHTLFVEWPERTMAGAVGVSGWMIRSTKPVVALEVTGGSYVQKPLAHSCLSEFSDVTGI